MKKQKYKVVIIKTLLKQYRVALFDKLYDELKKKDIELFVMYGKSDSNHSSRNDNIELNRKPYKKIKNFYFFKERLLLQWPGIKNLTDTDLLIIVNANRNIINFFFLIFKKIIFFKIALWGHARNNQSKRNNFFDFIKKKIVVQPDYWFSYSKIEYNYLKKLGYKKNNISIIDNAIDTISFSNEISEVTKKQLNYVRKKFNISKIDKIGLYCGSLYAEKRIQFLLDAAIRIYSSNNNFKLIIIGSGPDAKLVRDFSSVHQCVIYVDSVFGPEKQIFFSLADIFLNPGLTGLGILDAFSGSLPFITMTDSLHSPEISYLKNNKNGFMVDGGLNDFVKCSVKLLNDDKLRYSMGVAAYQTSQRYTLDNCVKKIKKGIMTCISK